MGDNTMSMLDAPQRYDQKLELISRMGVAGAVTYGLKSIVTFASKALGCFKAINPTAAALSNLPNNTAAVAVVKTTKSIFQNFLTCITSPDTTKSVTEGAFNYPLAAGLLACTIVDTAANSYVPQSSFKKECVRQIAGLATMHALGGLQGVLAYEMYRALFATCRLGYDLVCCKKNEISKYKIV